MSLAPLTSTELAVSNLIATASLSASLDVTIFAGLSNEDKQLPCVICWAEQAGNEVSFKSNVYPVTVNVHVAEAAADTPISASIANTVFSALTADRDKIVNNLSNAAPNYFAFSVVPEGLRNEVDGDAFIQTLQLRVVCCNT